MVRFAPEVLRAAALAVPLGADRAPAGARGPEHVDGRRPGSSAPTASGCGRRRRRWDDVAWLREQWDGPFMLKGVMRVDDARRAVEVGATAISVSNHGGNNLDGTPASIRALPAVVEAVGGEVEVLLDGGVRRGSDVVKALALGARAVMIGRAVPVGPGRRRAGGRGERARHPARRDRLRAARARARARSHELTPGRPR